MGNLERMISSIDVINKREESLVMMFTSYLEMLSVVDTEDKKEYEHLLVIIFVMIDDMFTLGMLQGCLKNELKGYATEIYNERKLV